MIFIKLPKFNPLGGQFAKIRKKKKSIFECLGYPNSGKPWLGSKDHSCKISVSWDQWYGRDLQKFGKFGKIRSSIFGYPNSGKPRPGPKDHPCEISVP